MKSESSYHAGELSVRERAGESERGQMNSRIISDSLIPATRSFIERQPMVVVGSVDYEGDVWASVLLGETGFMHAADSRTIEFDLARSHKNPHDPLWANIEQDPRAGLLMIELATRRRLRINGRVERIGTERLRLHVEESYPNCPKYIQRRHLVGVTAETGNGSDLPRAGHSIDASLEQVIGTADTFFVASVDPEGGVDASHRGGLPGFVRIVDEQTLRIPDYPGNSMFNTLGNFALNPRAGLAFLEFERNRMLQLVGRPEIRWDLDEPADDTDGTGRHWDLEIDRWLETPLPVRAEWEFLDYSPFNPVQVGGLG